MPARILVIEDNEDNLVLMTYLLRAFSHTVLFARDGSAGLDLARRELPDLVLSDIQMPGIDGYELVHIIRNDPRLVKLPMVAVTSYAMRGDREKALSAGFDGYIAKPIVPEEFVGQVEQFLDPAQRSAPIAETGPAPAPSENPPVLATILAVDNSPINLSVLVNTLEPFGFRVIPTASVKEALACALENPPDLILSDLHMPEADGFDFFAALKAHPRLRLVPFAIISSTFWPAGDLDRALHLGVTRFIQRPIEPHDLVAQVKSCLTGARSR